MELWQMSLQGAVIILCAIVIRSIGMNKLPKRTFLVIWGVALCRLMIPFRIDSPFSAYALVEQAIQLVPSTPMPPVTQTPIQTAATLPALTQEATFSPYAIAWILGMVLSALFFVIPHARCRSEFRQALPVDNTFIEHWRMAHRLLRPIQIRISDQIKTPLTYGVFRPVILLPKQLDLCDERALHYILMHEFTHIRRWDVLVKWVLAAAVCLHWFNPMVWVMLVLLSRDLELTCDEAVVKAFGQTTRSHYALMLLAMEEQKSRLTPLCNNFSKHAIEERITAIMKMKKVSIASMVLAVILVLGAVTAFATSAAIPLPAAPSASSSGLPDNTPPEDSYAKYAPFGLVYDAKTNRHYYQGKLVRSFKDMYPVDNNGGSAGTMYTYPDGEVDVCAIRDLSGPIVRNADGSFDPSGVLLGLEPSSQADFDTHTESLKKQLALWPSGTSVAYNSASSSGASAATITEVEPVQEVYVSSGNAAISEASAASFADNDSEQVIQASSGTAAISEASTTSQIQVVEDVAASALPSQRQGTHSYSVRLQSGVTVSFGPFGTQAEVIEAAKTYCDAQVAAGQMTQAEANQVLSQMPQVIAQDIR